MHFAKERITCYFRDRIRQSLTDTVPDSCWITLIDIHLFSICICLLLTLSIILLLNCFFFFCEDSSVYCKFVS